MMLKKPAKPKKASPVGWGSSSGRFVMRKANNSIKVSNKALAARLTPHKVGGYVVLDSPVQPEHLTRQQIADAIADLD